MTELTLKDACSLLCLLSSSLSCLSRYSMAFIFLLSSALVLFNSLFRSFRSLRMPSFSFSIFVTFAVHSLIYFGMNL